MSHEASNTKERCRIASNMLHKNGGHNNFKKMGLLLTSKNYEYVGQYVGQYP